MSEGNSSHVQDLPLQGSEANDPLLSTECSKLKRSASEKVRKTSNVEVNRSKTFSFWTKLRKEKRSDKRDDNRKAGVNEQCENDFDSQQLSKLSSSGEEELSIQKLVGIKCNHSLKIEEHVFCSDLQESKVQRYSTVKQYGKDLEGIERINAISPLTEGTLFLATKNMPFDLKDSCSPGKDTLESVQGVYEAYSFEEGKEELIQELQRLDRKDKPVNKRHILIILLVVLIFLTISSAFTTAVVILSQGTVSTVQTYFRNATPSQRTKLISNLVSIYKYDPSEEGAEEVKHINSDLLLKRSIFCEGSKMKGFNTFEGIPLAYQSDSEIRDLMVDEAFPLNRSVFYGLAYSPSGVIEPHCQVNRREVLLDMALLSKVTGRIKNYGMQCKQTEFILDAIQELNLNMTLSVGVWIGAYDRVNRDQILELKRVLMRYPRRLFESIYVGNEVLFRQDQTTKQLLSYIEEVKDFTTSLGYVDLPVGTVELGSLINDDIIRNSDIIGINVHPFFGGVKAEAGIKWTYDFIEQQVAPKVNGKRKVDITEVGWPSGGGLHNSAIASPNEFLLFLNQFICEAYRNNYGWYYFEAFDEPWKKVFYEDGNRWETEWGVFTSDRKLKSGISFHENNC